AREWQVPGGKRPGLPGRAAHRRPPGSQGARRRRQRRRHAMNTALDQRIVTRPPGDALLRRQGRERQTIKLLSANIQAGSSTRRYSDYAVRSWSHVLPAGGKRQALDQIAQLAGNHDIVGLQESDPGSW